MPHTIIDLLNRGIDANNADPFRHNNLVVLPREGNLVVSGDIHGHRRNFERIVSYADLAYNPDRHVLLQEIIHGGPEDENGGCLSYKVLLDAVRYKLKFPDQVHTILGNHDTAFINNSEVMKNGKEMNRAMRLAIDSVFPKSSDQVVLAMQQFLFSQPLAVRCENRIWLSHSLPADRYADKFDPEIFNRQLRVNDVVRPGSAYLLTWGRKHSQELLDKLAETFDVDLFILGHQPQEQGWNRMASNLLILASDHNHGTLLPIDLAEAYTVDKLVDSIIPLTSIR